MYVFAHLQVVPPSVLDDEQLFSEYITAFNDRLVVRSWYLA